MNLRHLFALGAFALVPALIDAQPARLRVPFTLDTLPNGLTLIVHEDHSVPIVTTNVWFHVGSGDEKVGRTGFAHLFEHLMFMGSENAPYPQFDRLLEASGANNNGSTTEDRTNYYEFGPASSLPLMLWLEADRMGWLLSTMDKPKVDLQRDVVKNERRQSYENQPYGMVGDIAPPLMFPAGHPYSWTVIGSMAAHASPRTTGPLMSGARPARAPTRFRAGSRVDSPLILSSTTPWLRALRRSASTVGSPR